MTMQRALQTSQQWWEKIKADENRMKGWLAKQYHGEMTAHLRITDFAARYAPDNRRVKHLLNLIAEQELLHAGWVRDLLVARGITPAILIKEEPYWNLTLPQITDFPTMTAVSAHAEGMRLERIRVIAADATGPADIREVFQRILPQEEFHERTFTEFAGDAAMAATIGQHQRGMESLGLIPPGM